MSFEAPADPWVPDEILAEANARHDAVVPPELHHIRLRSKWFDTVVGKLLSDKRIRKYERMGFYTAEFKRQRKEVAARRQARNRSAREGNFVKADDGRLIYSPLAA